MLRKAGSKHRLERHVAHQNGNPTDQRIRMGEHGRIETLGNDFVRDKCCSMAERKNPKMRIASKQTRDLGKTKIFDQDLSGPLAI